MPGVCPSVQISPRAGMALSKSPHERVPKLSLDRLSHAEGETFRRALSTMSGVLKYTRADLAKLKYHPVRPLDVISKEIGVRTLCVRR